MGNIVNGVDLIRKLKKEAFGVTSPLITSIRSKNGKTEKGAIWLNEEELSPYDYWQFWRNTDDRDVKRFIKFFTEIEVDEVENIFKKEKNINKLKILLANEATKILHGEDAAKKAAQTAKDTFEGGTVASGLPEINIKKKEIQEGINILDLIANNKILSSKSEARRVIANKGFKLNDKVIDDEKRKLQLKDFEKSTLKLSYGKKKHYIIKII